MPNLKEACLPVPGPDNSAPHTYSRSSSIFYCHQCLMSQVALFIEVCDQHFSNLMCILHARHISCPSIWSPHATSNCEVPHYGTSLSSYFLSPRHILSLFCSVLKILILSGQKPNFMPL